MSALQNMWNNACTRLNVKPKQFAILLAVSSLAVGALGVKVFVMKPKSASADTKAAAKAPRKAPDTQGGEPSTGTPTNPGVTASAFPQQVLTVIPVALESRPVRDPFVPFFLYQAPEDEEYNDATTDGQGVLVKPRTAGAGNAAKGKGGTKKAEAPEPPPPPTGPQGLALKAIISGRVAVLNNVSVEVGDVVHDAMGQAFTVREVHERSVVLSDGTRTWPVGYSAAQVGGKLGKPVGAGAKPAPARR